MPQYLMQNKLNISKLDSSYRRRVKVSASKSESNRALMIQAYSLQEQHISNLSDADDTLLLQSLLALIRLQKPSTDLVVVDCKNAGTVFRFLLSYLAQYEGIWLLTGSERMKNRPVGDLVVSLQSLGGDIQYAGKPGYPPLRIKGTRLFGGNVTVSMDLSSQFASSLLLGAPMWKNGLRLKLIGGMGSMPYLDLTLIMMEKFGARAFRVGNEVIVEAAEYQTSEYDVEPDWSGASYWYEWVALSDSDEIIIENLNPGSAQGDREVLTYFEKLGVGTEMQGRDLRLFKTGNVSNNLLFNLKETPDLMPALVTTCAGMGVHAIFNGLGNLAIKESDRTAVLLHELSKAGFSILKNSPEQIETFDSKVNIAQKSVSHQFNTHGDHRIAMCLAPLVLILNEIEIVDPEVVVKSYPGFWNELSQMVSLRLI